MATSYRVVRVFNNNAVLARLDEDEMVLVGRGIGFGAQVGQEIPAERAQQRFIADGSDKGRYLELINSISQETFDVISRGIDLAADLLGELHPSIYLMLTDHLVFAVQRLDEGATIANPLLHEIRAVFPEEFGAAQLVLQYINNKLGIQLPDDEAAFIALHLKGARRGESVKAPLHRANSLAAIVELVERKLDSAVGNGEIHDELVVVLAKLQERIATQNFRRNSAERSIQRDLSQETQLATNIVRQLLGSNDVPRAAAGEVANLAIFLHGWRQDLDTQLSADGSESKNRSR